MSSEILEKIDFMIADMRQELERVRKARQKPGHHIQFVTGEINDIIKKQSSKHPDEPVKALSYALSKVSDCIQRSFERIDMIEGNIVVAIQSYERVKDEIQKIESDREDEDEKVESEPEVSKSRMRKPGTRPVDKMASRKAKSNKIAEEPKKKRASKKRKTAKS